jgi:hypothetical protein
MRKTCYRKIYVFCNVCFLVFSNRCIAIDLFDDNRPLPIEVTKTSKAVNTQALPKVPELFLQTKLTNDVQKSTVKPLFSFSSIEQPVNSTSGIVGLNAINPTVRSVPKIKKKIVRQHVNHVTDAQKNFEWYQYNSPAFKTEE